jgi:hypothetical protein
MADGLHQGVGRGVGRRSIGIVHMYKPPRQLKRRRGDEQPTPYLFGATRSRSEMAWGSMSPGREGASTGLSSGDQVSSNVRAGHVQMQFEAQLWAPSCASPVQADAIKRLPDSMPFESAHPLKQAASRRITLPSAGISQVSPVFNRDVGQAHAHPKHLTH